MGQDFRLGAARKMCLNSSYTFENIIVFNICSDLIPEMYNFNVNQTLLLYYIYVDDIKKTRTY